VRDAVQKSARPPSGDLGYRVSSLRDLHYDGPGRLNRSIVPGENLAGVGAKWNPAD
jgi:hypothetical protein